MWLLGDLLTFKFAGASLSLTEITVFAENGPPPHIHLAADESFWVFEGEFSVLLGAQTITAGPGSFVHVPRGTLHTYSKTSREPGKMIVMLTPGGFENFSREVGEPATQRTTPPPIDPGIIEKVIDLAPKYQLRVPGLSG